MAAATKNVIVTDEQVHPDYAALMEFYGLLIACLRNDGARTCRTFRGVSDACMSRMIRLAEHEGFIPVPQGETLSVSRPTR